MNRLLILIIAAGALVLGGCGTNKFNNLGAVSLAPDLVVSDIKHVDVAGLNGDAEFEVVISNRGGASARGFRVSFIGYHYLDISVPPSACNPLKLGSVVYQEFDGLESGGALNTTVVMPLPDQYDPDSGNGDTGCRDDRSYSGTWVIVVTVDFDDDIIESNEGNNEGTLDFPVQPSDNDPDPSTIPTKPIGN